MLTITPYLIVIAILGAWFLGVFGVLFLIDFIRKAIEKEQLKHFGNGIGLEMEEDSPPPGGWKRHSNW